MRRKRRWLAGALFGFAAFAFVMMGLSAILLQRWSDLRTVSPEEADGAFSTATAAAGGGPPYLEISPAGTVHVRRDLERPEETDLRALNLLAWEPARGQLLEISFPFWFVRLKMTDRFNLGTLTSALARDWRNLDLKVSVEELRRRGPGLVVDHRLESGARILLWTE